MKNNIMLIGFMGTGKSTVSRQLSKTTGRKEIDLDKYIEEYMGINIPDIFAKYGEDKFRDIETECLKKVVSEEDAIISCGGGIVIRSENDNIMKENGTIVLLTAKPENIYDRVKNSTNRPVLNGNMNVEYIAGLLEKREPMYYRAAQLIISTDDKNVEEISREILDKIKKNS